MKNILLVLVFVCCVLGIDDPSVPNSFSAGARAVAADVNENFDSLETAAIRTNDTLDIEFVRFGDFSDSTFSKLMVTDYVTAPGGVHVGGTSDPATDNLIVDGNSALGTTITDAIRLKVFTNYTSGAAFSGWFQSTTSNANDNHSLYCTAQNAGAGDAYSFYGAHGLLYNAGAASFADKLDVTDFVTASGGLHVGGTSDPATDNLIVDGYSALGTTIEAGKQLKVTTTYTAGDAYGAYFQATTSNDNSNVSIYCTATNEGAGAAYSFYGGAGIMINVGEVQFSDKLRVADYVTADGGVHVGGASDPGTDNLLVDGDITASSNISVDSVIVMKESSTADSSAGYAKFYVVDGEMYVKDDEDNETKLSSHNPNGEWEYYSRNTTTGKVVRVNMENMIKKLEEFTGESFIEYE